MARQVDSGVFSGLDFLPFKVRTASCPPERKCLNLWEIMIFVTKCDPSVFLPLVSRCLLRMFCFLATHLLSVSRSHSVWLARLQNVLRLFRNMCEAMSSHALH